MEKVFTHLLDLLGVKRVDDLLFKIKPELKGHAEAVETIRENCEKCNRPHIIAWKFMKDGKPSSYRYSTICTNCLKGHETKEMTDEMVEMKNQSLLRKWYHIGPEDESGFKNFEVVDRVTEKASVEAKEYVREILQGNLTLNLLIMGSTGTGKTHIAKTIAKTAKSKGLNVACIEAVELFNLLKKTFGHERHNEMFFEEFKSFDLVVIDDVGLETKKMNEVSWSVTEWTKLINSREGKATVFTTNFDDLSLPDVIGARAFSRMYMNTKFIDLFTDDYRKKKVVK
jgi:DNA replication protein DnaC